MNYVVKLLIYKINDVIKLMRNNFCRRLILVFQLKDIAGGRLFAQLQIVVFKQEGEFDTFFLGDGIH